MKLLVCLIICLVVFIGYLQDKKNSNPYRRR